MRNLCLFSVVSFLLGCGVPMGNRIDAPNLQVYYLEGVTKSKAADFARYWVDNGFVGARKQVIQLEKENGIYLVKLIERAMYHHDQLTIDEQAKLQELGRNLAKKIFKNRTEIILTDNTFRPIERK